MIFIRTLTIFWLILGGLQHAFADIILTLEKPSSDTETRIHQRLQTSPTLHTAMEFLSQYFDTPTDVSLSFGSYERIWHKNGRIEIPYLFIKNTRDNYRSTHFKHKKLDVDTYTGNVLLHVILHEFAHALIAQYNLPVVGKEEDAADAFADVMLIHFFDQGSDIVISAADLFFIDDKRTQRVSDEDLWSDHSLDKQRYYDRLCYAYGSNPSRYNAVKRQAGFDERKSERCIFQYHQTKERWLTLLQPTFKHQSNSL
jgi:hypothetical protein